MPIYEYKCIDCNETTEAIQRREDPPLHSCPNCGGGLKKLLSAPAFQFKGTGWYITDYARKKEKSEAAAPAAKSNGEKSESKPAESSAKTNDSTKSASKKASPSSD